MDFTTKMVPSAAINYLSKALESLEHSANTMGAFVITGEFKLTVFGTGGDEYEFLVEWDEDADGYRVVLN